jgi:hypothetical protein
MDYAVVVADIVADSIVFSIVAVVEKLPDYFLLPYLP